MRLSRNTAVASLGAGQSYVFPAGTLGYEGDIEPDNGFRPEGLFHLSPTTINLPSPYYLLDFGYTYGARIATHHLSMYPKGNSLVFGTGTVQWSWGLDNNHDIPGGPPDMNLRQATVNLFADFGVQPVSLQPGLFAASGSTDTVAPKSAITFPQAGASVKAG